MFRLRLRRHRLKLLPYGSNLRRRPTSLRTTLFLCFINMWNQYIHSSFQFNYGYGFLQNLAGWKRKTDDQPQSSPPPPPWHLLPDDILRRVFKNLRVGDRARARLVCKSWELILTRGDIPQTPEAPWQIMSNDSYRKPESCLTEIQLRSMSEQRIYRFPLPDNHQAGWCCGSSCGWLLMAAGAPMSPDMFLWQPLSGATRKLPPLSTLPFFDEYRGFAMGGVIENPSSLVRRVEVFSIGDTECIVAAIFLRNTCSEIAMCSPQGKEWKVFGGEDQLKLLYCDILFHSEDKRLYAVATERTPLTPDALGNFASNNNEIRLTEHCRIPVLVFVPLLRVRSISTRLLHRRGLQLAQEQNYALHLVESSLTREILLVVVYIDCVANESPGNEDMVRFRCEQTTKMVVYVISGQPVLEALRNTGEETIFLGDGGSFSTPSVDGVCANCVYFATDDAKGLVVVHGNLSKCYAVREHGVFSLQHKKIRRTATKAVKFLSGSRVGWFMPQL